MVAALAACASIAGAYVGALYVGQRGGGGGGGAGARGAGRDDSRVIISRAVRVTFVCALAWVPTAALTHASSYTTRGDGARVGLARAMGLVPPMGVAKACVVGWAFAFALVFGSFIDDVLRGRATRKLARVLRVGKDLREFRDLCHAPLCEEFCFRACMAPLMALSGSSARMTPLFFGAAHAHHYFDMRARGVSRAVATRAVAVQFTYTTLFGAFAMFVFLYTESLAAATVAHAWCNLIGAPSTFTFRGSTKDVCVTICHFMGVALVAHASYMICSGGSHALSRRLPTASHWLA
jgi:prenyl protein peptidase